MLVVAEHALIRAGLCALFDSSAGFVVVADALDVPTAATLARTHEPHLVLLTARALTNAGVTGIAELRRELPSGCVLVLGDLDAADPARPCVDVCLPNDVGVRELRRMIAGLPGNHCATCALRPGCRASLLSAAFTRRERQVAIRVAEGMTSKQIAAALGVSVRTVNTYRESLARKLGASSAAVVTRFVIESGLHDDVAVAREG